MIEMAVRADETTEILGRARDAQAQIASCTQREVDALVAAAAWGVFEESRARTITTLAFEETAIGNVEETYQRHRRRVLGTLRDLHGAISVGVVEESRERGIRKIAKPVGVVAALTPTTAPTAAVAQNTLMTLKTRNAIIVCPHPRAQRSAAAVVRVLRHSLERVGAPADLVQCAKNPDRVLSQQIMAGADLVLAAGGEGTVHRACSSGTPAFGAGTGNAVVIVDETADVAACCARVFRGKYFDNGTSCSSESSLVIADGVWEEVLQRLGSLGAHLCSAAEAARLRRLMWPDGRKLAVAVVGKSAEHIAALAGFNVASGSRVLLCVPDGIPGADPFSFEKLSPVLALWKFREFDEAVRVVVQLTGSSGRGHSCGVFTRRNDRVDRLAHAVQLCRVMVNQSTGIANSGDFANGMPFTTTLCCGTWGGSHSSENVTWRQLLNYTWVSEPIEEQLPEPEVLFAEHWARCGRDWELRG